MSDDMQDRFTIQDLTREFDITSRTLRHYEDQGLLSPRREGQTRIYSGADRGRLIWVLRGRNVGFSLSEISDLLDLYDLNDDRATQRQATLEKCQDRIKALEAQRADIDTTIKELTEFCTLLDSVEMCNKTGKWIDKSTREPIIINKP